MSVHATTSRQLLLVEDNPGDAQFIMDMLDEAQPVPDCIVHVDTLAAAVARIDRLEPDAVLLDLRLPDATGVECVSAIRAHGGDIPIVVLTGIDDEALAMSCISAGAQDYLSKNDVRTAILRRSIGYAIARAAEGVERRRADAAQTRLAAIVEGSTDAIVSTTVDGIVTSWNGGAEAIFGFTAAEALGQPTRVVIAPIDATTEAEQTLLIAQVRDGGTPVSGQEIIRLRRDGTPVTLSAVASQLRGATGQVIGLAAICRDITTQRAMETQLALSDRMVAIGTLTAGVGHEINNPLAAVMANLELAIQEVEGSPSLVSASVDLLDELHDARDAAERIRQIVRDLKMFSRSESERRGPVDLHSVIDSTVRMAWNEIRHRARLVKDYGKIPPVDANDAKIGQVILNLLVNAAQAIPEGDQSGNEIRVSTGVNAKGNVFVTISDTGSGIPPEVQRRLFTAFFTTKPVGVGTGLGLAISRRLITSFDGEITFESEVGRGTRFTVTLLPSVPTETRAPAPLLYRVPGKRARVLVIDDEPTIATALTRLLSAEHDVTVVDSAGKAITLISHGQAFDIIFCDLMMPQMSGATFHATLTKLNADLAGRIVFMTGGAFTPAARDFLGTTGNHHVEKPFDLQQVRELVRDMVSASR